MCTKRHSNRAQVSPARRPVPLADHPAGGRGFSGVDAIIVTRHPSLATLLVERGVCPAGTPVIEHATPDDVQNQHVIGVLPMHLASLAASVTEVPIRMTLVDREAAQAGDLPLERLREIAGEAVCYRVTATPRADDEAQRLAQILSGCTLDEMKERVPAWVWDHGSQGYHTRPDVPSGGAYRYEDGQDACSAELAADGTRIRVRFFTDRGRWSRWAEIRDA